MCTKETAYIAGAGMAFTSLVTSKRVRGMQPIMQLVALLGSCVTEGRSAAGPRARALHRVDALLRVAELALFLLPLAPNRRLIISPLDHRLTQRGRPLADRDGATRSR